MQNCKTRTTPCEIDLNTIMNNEDGIAACEKEYRILIGSLIYVMTSTRPDICYTVTKLSQNLNKPRTVHLTRAKQVLRYLKGTKNQCLVFRHSKNPLQLEGFCDADWANSPDRKSITGYCFRLAKDNPIICWKSKKRDNFTFSLRSRIHCIVASNTRGYFS